MGLPLSVDLLGVEAAGLAEAEGVHCAVGCRDVPGVRGVAPADAVELLVGRLVVAVPGVDADLDEEVGAAEQRQVVLLPLRVAGRALDVDLAELELEAFAER